MFVEGWKRKRVDAFDGYTINRMLIIFNVYFMEWFELKLPSSLAFRLSRHFTCYMSKRKKNRRESFEHHKSDQISKCRNTMLHICIVGKLWNIIDTIIFWLAYQWKMAVQKAHHVAYMINESPIFLCLKIRFVGSVTYI